MCDWHCSVCGPPELKTKASVYIVRASLWRVRPGEEEEGLKDRREERRKMCTAGWRTAAETGLLVYAGCGAESTGKFLIALICYIQHRFSPCPALLSSPVSPRIDFFIFLPGIRRQRVRGAPLNGELSSDCRYSPAYCILSFVVPDDVQYAAAAPANKLGD